ncbi:MAG: peptidylprolyl isomerase [Flavobacteriales bacterium]|nr:peptidylprolyl isomerase [Flavobacteriales bacterium]
MAVIGKIRERSGLLLVIVGGALAAFILTDLFSGRGGQRDQVLGEVGGEEISLRRFEQRVGEELDSYRNDFGQQVTSQLQEQIRSSVWNEMVKAHVLLGRVERAGFALTKPEYDDIRFGNNILPEFRNQPNFQGPDGRPSPEALQQYFSSVQLNAPVYHAIQKRRITENRLYAKYNNLVKKSIFVNRVQAEDDFHGKNTKVSFDMVAHRYDQEPDSLFPVGDRDLRRYYDQHRNDPKHRQKPARRFEYVKFPVKATEADRLLGRRELEDLREEFASTQEDSLFVVMNSESRAYVLTPYAEGTADAETDTRMLEAAVGDVVGPYAEGETWKLVKVKELKAVPEARVRHILLSTQQGKGEDEQKKRADSLLTVVKRDRSKFPDLVSKFSDDPGSVNSGGVYEWFDKFRMVPEFTEASFDQKVGAITIAKTTYGFHIVEVLGQRDRMERMVATIDRGMRATPATYKEVYKQANEFSLRNKTLAAFQSAAEEAGLEVVKVDELRPDMRFVMGLQQPNSTISWVNRAKVGDVSEPLDAGDDHVVAILTGIREEGPPALDDVRELFTREVMKEKKGEELVKRMKGNTDLPSLAQTLGTTVQPVSEMLLSATSIPGGYTEFEVIGQIFAMETGQTSVPLKGETGVFVVKVTNTSATPEPGDVATERSSQTTRIRGRAENALYNALREAVGVKDDRSRYY